MKHRGDPLNGTHVARWLESGAYSGSARGQRFNKNSARLNYNASNWRSARNSHGKYPPLNRHQWGQAWRWIQHHWPDNPQNHNQWKLHSNRRGTLLAYSDMPEYDDASRVVRKNEEAWVHMRDENERADAHTRGIVFLTDQNGNRISKHKYHGVAAAMIEALANLGEGN